MSNIITLAAGSCTEIDLVIVAVNGKWITENEHLVKFNKASLKEALEAMGFELKN